MSELQRECGLAKTGQPRHCDYRSGNAKPLSQLGQLRFASDEQRRLGRKIQRWRGCGHNTEQPSLDLPKTIRLISSEIEVFLIANQARNLAIPVESAD